jgi:hypothetical protein
MREPNWNRSEVAVSFVCAVNVPAGKLARVDASQTVYVDSHQLRTVRHLSERKALNATCLAKQVLNHFIVEAVFREIAHARNETERFPRSEGKNKAHGLTARTVAYDCAGKVRVHFVAHGATLTATVIVSKHDKSFNGFDSQGRLEAAATDRNGL